MMSDNIKQNSLEKQKNSPNFFKSRQKRNSVKTAFRKNDICITNKVDFKAQIKQCENHLNSEGEVFLHCLGNAINRGTNLLLTLLKNSFEELDYTANTSTVELYDDYHPLNEVDKFTTKSRMNSCLHIRIYKKDIAFKNV